MAFGVAISTFHGLGASPFDTLTFNISTIANFDLGITMFIFNGLFLLIYFLKYKNKDIYISIIVIFLFSISVNLFVKLLTPFIVNNELWFRLILFIVGFMLTNVGIAMVEISSLSKTAYECFNAFVSNTFFKKMSYGKSRIIVDISVSAAAALLGIIFINSIGSSGIGTIFYMIFTGPCVQILMKLMSTKK